MIAKKHAGCTIPEAGTPYVIDLQWTGAIKCYLIVRKTANDLLAHLGALAWKEASVITGNNTFVYMEGEHTVEVKVMVKQMIEPGEEKIETSHGDEVLAVVSQSANEFKPSPVKPGVLEVFGGNTTWNPPMKVKEVIISNPGDPGWEDIYFLELQDLTNGKYITNHIKNYISQTSDETEMRWPGQKEAGPWILTLLVKPPTTVCIAVWDNLNRICQEEDTPVEECLMSKDSQSLDGNLPEILTKSGWRSEISKITRNDTKRLPFNYLRFCKDMSNDFAPDEEMEVEIPGVTGILMSAVFSPPTDPPEEEPEEVVASGAGAGESGGH